MRIVVLGGSGLIGSKLVNLLRQEDQDVVSASHCVWAEYRHRGRRR